MHNQHFLSYLNKNRSLLRFTKSEWEPWNPRTCSTSIFVRHNLCWGKKIVKQDSGKGEVSEQMPHCQHLPPPIFLSLSNRDSLRVIQTLSPGTSQVQSNTSYVGKILWKILYLLLFSRPVWSSKEEWQTKGYQPLRCSFFWSPPQTGQHHGPPAASHDGGCLWGYRWWRWKAPALLIGWWRWRE